jgi:hypothetical protein
LPLLLRAGVASVRAAVQQLRVQADSDEDVRSHCGGEVALDEGPRGFVEQFRSVLECRLQRCLELPGHPVPERSDVVHRDVAVQGPDRIGSEPCEGISSALRTAGRGGGPELLQEVGELFFRLCPRECARSVRRQSPQREED